MDATTDRNSLQQLTLTIDERARSLLLTTKNGDLPAHEEDPRLLVTVNEASRMLSMGKSYVQVLVARGEIPSIKLGKSRRIAVSALRAYVHRLEAEQAGTAPP